MLSLKPAWTSKACKQKQPFGLFSNKVWATALHTFESRYGEALTPK